MTVTDPVLVGAGDIAPDCVVGREHRERAGHRHAPRRTSRHGLHARRQRVRRRHGAAVRELLRARRGAATRRARVRSAGNHDYNTPNATAYYDYFNGVGNQTGPAGDRTPAATTATTSATGTSSSSTASAHVGPLSAGLPTGAPSVRRRSSGCGDDLATSPTNNIIAMWHRPLYSSSSPPTTHAYLQPLWQALYDYGVDIWLGGHWHNYERLAPMNATGAARRRVRHPDRSSSAPAASAVSGIRHDPRRDQRGAEHHHLRRHEVHAPRHSSYDWQFIPIAGRAAVFTDSGTGPCTAHLATSPRRECRHRSDDRAPARRRWPAA